MSSRRPGPTLTPEQLTIVWQSASLLLDYPDEDLLDRTDLLRSASHGAPPSIGDSIRSYLDHLESTPLPELQAAYVETFDNRRRCNLFLTYFAHGDTRKRGMALLRFKQVYLGAGFELDDAELPDHLCVVLEFAATVDQELGRDLMLDHRAGLELLRISLRDLTSPWASLLDAVTATLPPLRGEERDAVRRLAAEGPPEEEVGLAPFANPQFSPGASAGPPPGAASASIPLPMPSFPGARS
jgi:nitrate reductase delta subunit